MAHKRKKANKTACCVLYLGEEESVEPGKVGGEIGNEQNWLVRDPNFRNEVLILHPLYHERRAPLSGHLPPL